MAYIKETSYLGFQMKSYCDYLIDDENISKTENLYTFLYRKIQDSCAEHKFRHIKH